MDVGVTGLTVAVEEFCFDWAGRLEIQVIPEG